MTKYRTKFFRDMDSDTGGGTSVRLVPESGDLEVGTRGEKFCNRHYADVENPYKNPALYRQMLREQAMIRARVRARLI